MRTTTILICLALVPAGLMIGCAPETASSPDTTTAGANDDGHDHTADHEGPHGGVVIELGRNHHFHAEIVEDPDKESVAVYILDTNLKELPIDAQQITISLDVDGSSTTFELQAADVRDGKASRFVASSHELYDAMHEHEATGKLRATINGTPYSGEVAHHHHDDGHSHAGDDASKDH